MKRKATTPTTSTLPAGYGPLLLNSAGQVVVDGDIYGVQRTADRPYAILQSLTAGPRLLRFEVRGGDHYAITADGDRKNRAELSGRPLAHHTDIWFAYRMRVRAGTPVPAWTALGQFHSKPDAGDMAGMSPPFAIELRPDGLGGERLVAVRRTDPNALTTVKPAAPLLFSRPFTRETWLPIVGRVRFGWENDGAVELWLGQTKVVDLPQVSIGYNDDGAPYWKFGIYRSAAANTLAVEYANMEVGLDSLLGRVSAPLAI